MSKIQDALSKIQRTAMRSTDRANNTARAREAKSGSADRAGPTNELPASKFGSGSLTIDLDLLRNAGLLVPEDQQWQFAVQFRLIKRPLLDNAAGKGAYQSPVANLIMVTGALSGDGKTFNCINLALSMAVERDTSVLLVDADVAKPHISQLLGIGDENGLIDLLVKPSLKISDVAIRTNVPGLSILPAGHYNEDATELLASRSMENLVSDLSERYSDKIVIFDSPPLLATSEARVLAGLMGQIVVVVCANRTPRQAVLEAIDTLDPEKAINLIFNQASSDYDGSAYGRYGDAYGYEHRQRTDGS